MRCRSVWPLALLLSLLLVGPAPAEDAEENGAAAEARAGMVARVEAEIRAIAEETGIAEVDRRVLDVMAEIPRHVFVPEELRPFAYTPHPLPLGHGQNLSAPFLAALMTHLAEVGPGDVVFETGTDTGYQAAVLARLVDRVYSVEVIEPLAEEAIRILDELGYDNIEVKADDGYYGWAEHGPFDAIILKEAIDHVPAPLVDQLKPGGRLVMPLGPDRGPQILTVVVKCEVGTLTGRAVLPVRFSPLQGGERT
jgi:protein-L-isoaspartate(D-aspartate) O-methyltransferase